MAARAGAHCARARFAPRERMSKPLGFVFSGTSPIVETRASWRQAKPLPFNKLGLDRGLHSHYKNFIQTKTMSEFVYQENICEGAIREERTRVAGELDTFLQTFLSASMQLGVAADRLPSDSPVKTRLDRILQIMDEGTKVGLKRIQIWLSQQPPKRKLESRLYLSVEVTAQEKKIIEAALRECLGRVFGPSGAAAKLGIARATLESKIRSLKIDKKRSKHHRGT
jgi:Histidine kinase